jgi:uncharacterized membrane protein
MSNFIFNHIINIGELIYSNVIYIILAIIIGLSIDTVYGEYHSSCYKDVPLYSLLLDILSHIIILSIFVYVTVQSVNSLPTPFSSANRNKTKQLADGTLYVAMIFVFQKNLFAKIKYALSRIDSKRFKYTDD